MKIQLERDDCGKAVVKYLLMKMSKDKHYLCKGIRRKCDSLVSIKDELFSYGIVSRGIALSSSELSKLKKNSIVRIEKNEVGHFIVFLERKKNKYYFYDPMKDKMCIKNIRDVKVTSALIVEEKKIKKLPAMRFLKLEEHLILAFLSVLEAIATIFSLGMLQHQQSFAIICLSVFVMLILFHVLYLFELEKKLSKRFMFPYLKKCLNFKDYKKIQEVKMDFIRVPATVYSTISLTGVLLYLLLVIGLPYFVSILICCLSFFFIDLFVRRIADKRNMIIQQYEDSFINKLKKKSFQLEAYEASLKEGKIVAWIIMMKNIIKCIIAFIFALTTAILYKQVYLEFIVQLIITYFSLSLVMNRLFKNIMDLDFYHMKLSLLDGYSYELLVP